MHADHNDWGAINYLGIGDSDGNSRVATEIVTEQPVPDRG